ncbi:Fibulin-1 [Amphibalanus amphitrite]|uniref:Fibulin-1 n=1 Tax=Amphibalanus amphitrite TaxID=1232801 RepID=A0A6A4XGL0_AMPAM|nr:Fibulin-1 [Amphibalanus amphitrite]
MVLVGLATSLDLKKSLGKGVGQFQLQVVNPFQRVIKQLNQAQEAALYAEVSQKVAVRGEYDRRRGITAESIAEMVLNVAYTLRHHKFNEFDRRYERQWSESGRRPARNLFLRFPRPALTSLHSAVSDQCWQSLYQCLWYLNTVTKQTYTARRFDPLAQLQRTFKEPATVANVARWRAENGTRFQRLLTSHTWRCAQLHKTQTEQPDPFRSLVERFRWMTTASYFMCWYTMHQMPELAYFAERCDNYADCMQTPDSTEVGNQDPRVHSTDTPFACALYSFCPEVCCPLRTVRSLEQCTKSPLNPCMPDNRPGERDCKFDAAANRHFDALITNYLNVSCRCPRGHRFSAYFRRCVDIDECYEGADDCDRTSEACLNLRGDFDCVCRYGFYWNASETACKPSGQVRLRAETALVQLRRSAQNKSLSERLRQIEVDLRRQQLRQYLEWLPFDTSRVPSLGDVSEKFGKFRKRVSEFRELVGMGMSAAWRLRSEAVVCSVMVFCVAFLAS